MLIFDTEQSMPANTHLSGVHMLTFFDGDVTDGESAYLLAIREKVGLPVCLFLWLIVSTLPTPHTLTASHQLRGINLRSMLC